MTPFDLVDVVVAIGLYLWWKRVRHWSLAVLALSMVAPGVGYLAMCLWLLFSSPQVGNDSPFLRGLEGELLYYGYWGVSILRVIGSVGLILAARGNALVRKPE